MRRTIMLLAALPLFACRGGEGGGGKATVDTSAVGVIHVTNAARGVWDSAHAWHLEEDLRIGGADTGAGGFSQIKNLEVDAAGRIYVLEVNPERISVFDVNGHPVRTIGRQGSGPGEFEQAAGMAWDTAGRLWVVNQRNNRYSVFDTAGKLFEEPRRPVTGYSTWRWQGIITRANRIVDVTALQPGFRTVLLRLDSAFQPADTVPLPHFDAPMFKIEREGMSASYSVPFAPQLAWILGPDGALWYATTDQYRIIHLTPRGDTALVITRAFQPVPVTAAEKDTAVAHLAGFVRQGGVVDRSKIPDAKPPFGSLYLDDRGYLWTQRDLLAEAGGASFDVFDPSGRFLGTVTTSTALTWPILVRGTALYAVTNDDDGVPFVVRLRIRGR